MNNTDDFAVIVQGSSNYIDYIRFAFKDYFIIYSTWEGEESKYLDNEIVIYNKFPNFCGPANLNLQKITTISGLKEAKQRGFKRALKIRSDIIPTNTKKFIDLINNNYINFLCWHEHEVYPNCPGYLVDYLMSGFIDDLLELWNIEDMSFCSVPEIYITNQYIDKLMNKIDIKYFLSNLDDDNDLFWIKNNIKLSSYKKNFIYDKYKKYDFSLNKEHLKKNYINFLKR